MFLFPKVYRPLNVDFSRRFKLLSETCSGYIFTFCTGRNKGLNVGGFSLFSESADSGLGINFLKRMWIQIVTPFWLLRRKGQIDAIIAYDPYASGFAGMILKLLLGAKLIVEINGDYHKLKTSTNLLKIWLMKLIFRTTVSLADAVKVLNRDQESFINQHYPGTTVYRFQDFTATEFFQSLECYQGDYLLSVGHPFDLKGVDVLIRAANQMLYKHPKMKLKIMGYCPDEELRKYAKMAEDNPQIEFVKAGWIEDVGEQMRGCYLLVNAARFEAMGRVHLEAMACQKPVVATRTNGGLDYIEDGRTGLLCEIEDVDDLAKKLDSLLSNPKNATEMGRAGFARLQKHYSEENYVKSFLAMIEGVVSNKK